MEKIDFNQLIKSTHVDKNIFKPNLTSQLSFETAILEIKKNFKVLDLGCGSGIIGIAIMKQYLIILKCIVRTLISNQLRLLKIIL